MVQGSASGSLDATSLEELEAAFRDRRRSRWAQREFNHVWSALHRCRVCGIRRADVTRPVELRRRGDVAHFANLQTCGSGWACPVCSAKVRFGRAGEVAMAAAGQLAAGGGLVFLTLTMPHDRTQSLAELIDAVANGWRRVGSHRSWKGLDAEGFIRALEMTYGQANGWHAHLHLLLFLPVPVLDVEALKELLYELWSGVIVAQGYERPDWEHGIDLVPVGDVEGIARYVAKVEGASLELAYADRKKGKNGNRSPLQLLDDARTLGEKGDLAKWNEYELATKGRRALTWSRGLKKRFGVGEKSDEELAAEEVGGEVLALIEEGLWSLLLRDRGSLVRLLEMAEKPDGERVVGEFLGSIRRARKVCV